MPDQHTDSQKRQTAFNTFLLNRDSVLREREADEAEKLKLDEEVKADGDGKE